MGVVEAMDGLGVSGFLYAMDRGEVKVYYENLDTAPLKAFRDHRARVFNKKFEKVGSYKEMIDGGANTIYFTLRGARGELAPVYNEFKKISGVGAILCDDNYSPDLCFLECYGIGVSKSAAVDFIRARGGYSHVVGFGDNLNDLPLFQACDERYAPGNALPEVKKAATAVIAPNTEDGVARWLLSRHGRAL